MTVRRTDRPLDELLDHMAGVWPDHAVHLAEAATAIRAIFAAQDQTPRVLITSGWQVDPLLVEVENVAADIDEAHTSIGYAVDRLEDIRRLLRKQLHEPATPAPTAGATA